MSQKTRKTVARAAATCARPGETSSAWALNAPTPHAEPARCVLARAAAQRPGCGKSGHADRSSSSASEISIRALRRRAGLPCSTQQGKHAPFMEPLAIRRALLQGTEAYTGLATNERESRCSSLTCSCHVRAGVVLQGAGSAVMLTRDGDHRPIFRQPLRAMVFLQLLAARSPQGDAS